VGVAEPTNVVSMSHIDTEVTFVAAAAFEPAAVDVRPAAATNDLSRAD